MFLRIFQFLLGLLAYIELFIIIIFFLRGKRSLLNPHCFGLHGSAKKIKAWEVGAERTRSQSPSLVKVRSQNFILRIRETLLGFMQGNNNLICIYKTQSSRSMEQRLEE